MDLGLANKVAFVAASGQGLGKGVALELAREGAQLIICDINKEALALAEQEIQNAGGKQVLSIPGNLSKEKDRANIIAKVLQRFNAVDILVTNTGGPPPGRFEELNA